MFKRDGKVGYNHNYVCNGDPALLRPVAKLSHEGTGIVLETSSNTPGLNLYTADYFPEIPGKNGAVYNIRAGLCLETQAYPDSINVDPANPAWEEFRKGQTHILTPGGEPYKHMVIYSFGVDGVDQGGENGGEPKAAEGKTENKSEL